MFKFRELFSRQPKPQDFWETSMNVSLMNPSRGAFKSPLELMMSLTWNSGEFLDCKDFSNKREVRKMIEDAKGIDEEKRKLFFDECDRLFDVKALQELSRK